MSVLKFYKYVCIGLFINASSAALYAQSSDSLWIEGYIYDKKGSGYISDVRISSPTLSQSAIFANRQGTFRVRVPRQTEYSFGFDKSGFKTVTTSFRADNVLVKDSIWYAKIPMERALGYTLDVSLTELVKEGDASAMAFAVDGATIEVYNNTLQREELRLVNHTAHNFSFLLQQGNEYIFMIRKKGYYAKRMRANVNVNGCILCMEGFGTVTPGVVDNLTANNTMGALMGGVSLKKMVLNETVKIENIYYDVNSAALRPEAMKQLDQLAELLRDNPQVIIELSSHTDARGGKQDNLALSQKRADGVVAYLKSKGNLDKNKLTAKGYGESKPVNSCVDGIDCTEELHQQNRRTEFTVIDILKNDAMEQRSLASIMQEENLDKIVAANEEKYVEAEATPSPAVVSTAPRTKRPPQAIPMQYTGFKVELTVETQAPTMEHAIFSDFEDVYLDIDAANKFSFLVGSFAQRSDADTLLKRYKGKYPQARVVEFRAGVRQ